MKKLFKNWAPVILSGVAGLVVAITISNCSSSSSTGTNYVQVERLARPVVNEALVRVNSDLNAWNSIAPTLDLGSVNTTVVADASVTLQALYAGACFVNGALTVLGSAVQLKPAGQTCVANGLAILGSGNIGLSTAVSTAATSYANLVLGQFAPDVMRVDTAVASGYNAELCGAAAANVPLLCGGRKLDDDVMGITYAYLLNGEAAPSVASSIRPGTYYTPATTDSTCTAVNAGANKCNNGVAYTNPGQGHTAVNTTMPFGPTPWM